LKVIKAINIIIPPQPFPPILGSMFMLYILQETARLSVCLPGAGFNPLDFLLPCGLPVSCCLDTSVVWSRNLGTQQAEGL